jgi:arylsulfatase A-like enzyme
MHNLRGAFRCLAGAIITLLVICGCSQSRSADSQTYGVSSGASAVVFFVDGLALDRFEALAADGRLPNLRARFIEGGVRVDKAVTSLPSITYPVTVSLLTGVFPGHHGVLGNRWFDRSSTFLRDYGYLATYRAVNDDFSHPTLFEILDDRFTVAVQAVTFRGASINIDNPIDSGLDWSSGRFSSVDARVGRSFDRVAVAARKRGQWPAVYWNYFPGVDEIGHRFGSGSPEYEQALTVVDEAIGRIIAGVEMSAPGDAVYYVLVTDHGHQTCPPERKVDLKAWVERSQGLKVFSGDLQGGIAGLRAMTLNRYGAVIINGAFRRGAIFLRGPEGWESEPSADAIRRIVEGDDEQAGIAAVPGIAVACYREAPGVVHVVSRGGRGLIERRVRPGGKEYRLVPDGDVLGYMRNADLAAFVAGGWHDSRSWLAATGGEEFPDFVPQIVELFDSPRAGDVVVFAESDWTFDPQLPGGHGSVVAADMRVPFYFAGPDLPAGASIPCGRTVDLVPTVLDLLGELHRLADLSLDGISLARDLRTAGTSTVASGHRP